MQLQTECPVSGSRPKRERRLGASDLLLREPNEQSHSSQIREYYRGQERSVQGGMGGIANGNQLNALTNKMHFTNINT